MGPWDFPPEPPAAPRSPLGCLLAVAVGALLFAAIIALVMRIIVRIGGIG